MLDKTVIKVFGNPPAIGDYGIEIEMEADDIGFPMPPKPWASDHDGSLKAAYAIEYLTKGPLKKENVAKALEDLNKSLVNYGTPVNESIRAGVHVHLNCQNMTIKQMFHVALTYLAMETALVRWCGPNRVGNHFCLRSSDAEQQLERIRWSIMQGSLAGLTDYSNRYSSLNLAPLASFGSIEFRAMQTHPGLLGINEWVQMIDAIKNYGLGLNNLQDIASEISFHGPSMWVREVLGDKLFKLVNYPQLDKDVMKDLRNIQPILYAGDV